MWKHPWVRIPLSPPHFPNAKEYRHNGFGTQKYPSGRRGSPAKGVGRETVARVQIPPSAPARRKRHIACDEFFPFRTKLIARSFCCSSLPTATRSAAVGGFAALRMGPAPCGYCAGLAVGCRRCAAVLFRARARIFLTTQGKRKTRLTPCLSFWGAALHKK